MENENWRDIVGYEGAYQVSDHGRVRSVDREVKVRDFVRQLKGRIRKPYTNGDKDGQRHRKVVLLYNKRRRVEYVHRLVLEAFVGPCPEGMECCHNDGNPANNHVSNIRWDTRAANVRDCAMHGRTWRPQGVKHPKAVLSEEDVRQIRKRRAAGEKYVTLAREYGVTDATVRHAALGLTWSHIDD